jgi:hypothetical protein
MIGQPLARFEDVDEAAMPTTPLNLWKVLQTKA